VINFTSSKDEAFAAFISTHKEFDALTTIFRCIDNEIDLQRRELAVWALRNFSVHRESSNKIAKNPIFTKMIFGTLLMNVTASVENALELTFNILRQNDLAQQILPLQPLANVARKGEFVSVFLPKLAGWSKIAQATYYLVIGLICRD
jgi:hypothetical protein